MKMAIHTVSLLIFNLLLFIIPSYVSASESESEFLRSASELVSFSNEINLVDDLLHQGEYYIALNEINSTLNGNPRREVRLRILIRKSIVLINLSKAQEAQDVILSITQELENEEFKHSVAQFELKYVLGKLHFFKGDYERSIVSLQSALNWNSNFSKSNSKLYVEVLNELGLNYLLSGNYEASDSILKVADSFSEITPLDKAKNDQYFSYLYYEQGKYDKADSLIENSIRVRRDMLGVNSHVYAESLDMQGSIKERKALNDVADSLYNIVYKIRKNYFEEDNVVFAVSLNNLASIKWSKGDNEKAVQIYLEALAMREKLQGKMHPEYLVVLNNLAVSYVMLGKYKDGLQLFLDIRKISEITLGKDHPEHGTNLNNLAFTYFKLGQYRKTKDIYLEALSFRGRTIGENHPNYLSTLNNIGLLYNKLGECEESEAAFLKCKELCRINLGVEHPQYAKILNNLASVYDDIGEFKKCEAAYLESLDLYEKLNGKSHTSYATVKSNLGTLYKELGRTEDAYSYFKETSLIFKEISGENGEQYAVAIGTLGLLEINKGNLNEAQKLIEESNKIYLEILGEDHIQYAIGLANLATLYQEKGDFEQAEKMFLKALKIEEAAVLKTSDTYITTLRNLLQLYVETENFEKSIVYSEILLDSQISLMEDGLDFMSEAQKIKFKNNTIGNFTYAKNNALKTNNQNYLSKIYNLCLYEKGLLLNSSISTKNFVFAQKDSSLLSQYIELNDFKKQFLNNILANKTDQYIVSEIAEREKELAKASAYFRNEQLKNKIDVNHIRKELKPQEVAIEFTYFKNKGEITYAALILNASNDEISMVELFNENQLVSQNKMSRIDYVNALYSNSGGVVKVRRNEIESLYGLIWKPLMPYLKDAKSIYYSGVGVLQRLNLEAISIDASTIMAEEFEMINLSSTRNIVKDSIAIEYAQTSYVIGGVDYGSQPQLDVEDRQAVANSIDAFGERSFEDKWNYLPYSLKECRNINLTLSSNGFHQIYLEEGFATEQSFKQIGLLEKSPRVIHLATHGFFFSDPKTLTLVDSSMIYTIADDPMLRSGLVMSGANVSWTGDNVIDSGNDGILTAFEVANMNLTNTELVVLSACETGLGEIDGNEGVYGLQRAFKKAGVKNLIMSLWKIPDEETAVFMSRFYNVWLNNNLTIREAFNKTQIEMRENYIEPYKWAGFILID